MKAGEWEIITTTEVVGMPFDPRPMTSKHCYAQKDVEDVKAIAPEADKRQNCQRENFITSGHKVTWSIRCDGKRGGNGSGEMTFQGASYESTVKTKIQDPWRGAQDMIQRVKGRRIGECY